MIYAINGSPRKSGNTAALLSAVLEGAASQGAETRLVHLRDLRFRGCSSCFACKLKGRLHGVCAMKDDLSELLAGLDAADGIVMGSPIYYMTATPELMAFAHRFLFSHMLYNKKDRWLFPRRIPSAFVYTMGAGEERAGGILKSFEFLHSSMGRMLGMEPEILCAADTWQFRDYSLYEADQFDMESKRRSRDTVFPATLDKARELGGRMAAGAPRD